MVVYPVCLNCPRCGRLHGAIGGLVGTLRIENGPGRPGTVAELYEGHELPAVLARLLNDKVWCEPVGDYVLMDDPARVYLTPKRSE